MALSDLKVYSEYAYSAMTEILDQQIAVFNQASEGAIILRPSATQGDYSEQAFYAKIQGLVRRRNAYGDGAIAQKVLQMLAERSVKVAAGTPEVRIDPGWFQWIQRSPEEAGIVLGQQLAVDAMADMVNTVIGVIVSALSGVGAPVIRDISNAASGNKVINFVDMTRTAGLYGDRSQDLRVWVMHSASQTELYVNALNNMERLFTWGGTTVNRDAQGRIMIITDSPALVTTVTGDNTKVAYNNLLLKQGAATVGQENDWFANEETKNGQENIVRTYQAQWSYSLAVDGFAWDTATGGKSPNDAALMSAANWDRVSTYVKDLPGAILKTAAAA